MTHPNYTIAKQASTLQGIVDDVMSSAGDTWKDINFRQRPFYTIFKYLTPSWLMFRGNWVLAALMALAEEFVGVGPSIIGSMIDSALGLGSAGGAKTVSDAGLMQASKGVVDKILGATMMKSSAFEANVMKNGVTTEAMLSAWAAGPDNLHKEAATARGRLNLIKRWLGKTGRGERLPLITMVYSLLKKFVLGMGLFTGIKLVKKQFGRRRPFGLPVGIPGISGDKAPAAPSGAFMNPAAGFAEWQNVGGVERSIIMALDRAVKDRRGRPFSVLFTGIQGRPLRGSGSMRRLLEDIRMAHGWAPLRELDRSRYFLAPPIMETAKRLLPQLKYSPGKTVDTTDVEKRLESILGKGQKPTARKSPSGAETALGKILGGKQ